MTFRAPVLLLFLLVAVALTGCDSPKKKAGPPLPPLVVRDALRKEEAEAFFREFPDSIQMLVVFRSPPGSPERAQEQSTYVRLEGIAAEYSDVVVVVRADLNHMKGVESVAPPGVLVVDYTLHGSILTPGGTGRPTDRQIRAMMEKRREEVQPQASASPAASSPVPASSQGSMTPAKKGDLPLGMEKRGSH